MNTPGHIASSKDTLDTLRAALAQLELEKQNLVSQRDEALLSSVRHVMMQDIVGDYAEPSEVPEWTWIENNATYAHTWNGNGDGIWEFMLNMSCEFSDIPPKLKPVLEAATRDRVGYVLFHQGT